MTEHEVVLEINNLTHHIKGNPWPGVLRETSVEWLERFRVEMVALLRVVAPLSELDDDGLRSVREVAQLRRPGITLDDPALKQCELVKRAVDYVALRRALNQSGQIDKQRS